MLISATHPVDQTEQWIAKVKDHGNMLLLERGKSRPLAIGVLNYTTCLLRLEYTHR